LVRRLSRGVSTSQAYSFAVTSVSRLLSLSVMATSADLGVALEQVMMMSSRNKVNVQALLAAPLRMPVDSRCLGAKVLDTYFQVHNMFITMVLKLGRKSNSSRGLQWTAYLVVAGSPRFIRCSRSNQLMSISLMETVENRKVPSLIEKELKTAGECA
jgi:hypothetical protein